MLKRRTCNNQLGKYVYIGYAYSMRYSFNNNRNKNESDPNADVCVYKIYVNCLRSETKHSNDKPFFALSLSLSPSLDEIKGNFQT